MNGLQDKTTEPSAATDVGRRTDELIQLLTHQRTLYRHLQTLADRQRALVLADDVSPLLTLLAERQRLVDGLTGLNAKLAPYRRRWTELYNDFDESTRRRVSRLLEEANATLGAVLKSDGRDCGTLSVRREDTAARLARMETQSRASAAYAAGGAGVRRLGPETEG